MAKQRKQPAAQQPQAAAVAPTPAVPAPVAAPSVVMLLAPALPVVAQAPVEPEPTPEVSPPLTDAECAAFMGVVDKPAAPEPVEPEPPRMTAEQRENPRYLTGEALRALAHRRGIARSEAARLSDEKLREQLRYITAHQQETEAT